MKKKVLILILVVTSFFISRFLINEVFVAGTPRIQQDLAKRLSGRLGNFIARINLFGKTSQENTGEPKMLAEPIYDSDTIKKNILNTSSFNVLTKGVYGKEVDNITYTVVKQNEVEWLEYTFTVNGKELKIKVPKGQTPPTQQMAEQIYK